MVANALCHDKDIQDAYFDGILHVVLGERPENRSELFLISSA